MSRLNKLLFVALGTFAILSIQLDAIKIEENLYNQATNPLAPENIQLIGQQRKQLITEYLKAVNKTAKMCELAGADKSAVSICITGSQLTFDVLELVTEIITEALVKAHSLETKDPEIAIATVNNAIDDATTKIFAATSKVETVYGKSLQKVGELAKPGLRKAIINIQISGVDFFDCLDNIKQSPSEVIKPGRSQSESNIAENLEKFNSVIDVILKNMLVVAKNAFEGLSAAAGKVPVPATFSHISSVNVSNELPEVQNAIDELTTELNEFLNSKTSQSKIEAVKIIYNSSISSIYDTSKAIEKALETINNAENVLVQNREPENAAAELHERMTEVGNDILNASADAILGLGAASQVYGDELMEANKLAFNYLSTGRVNLSRDIKTVEKKAMDLLKGGKVDLEDARSILLASAKAVIQNYKEGAQTPLSFLKSVK